MKMMLAVAVGGALGSLGRYGTTLLLRTWTLEFPWGTLLVNTLGGFLMGALAGFASYQPLPDWLRLGLATGVLGGFTTFSAFSLETLLLWQKGQSSLALINLFANVLLSLASCALGYAALQRSSSAVL